MSARRVIIEYGATDNTAECETCHEAVGDGFQRRTARTWAANHVRATGHTVYVLAERGCHYRPEVERARAVSVPTPGDTT